LNDVGQSNGFGGSLERALGSITAKAVVMAGQTDLFFTPEDIPRIAEVLGGEPRPPSPIRRISTQPPHSAYLKIAEGCSNRCTYCTIPSIRGGFRSIPADVLVAEARDLVARGTVELNLVGQDVTSYGADLGDPGALARLLLRLSEADGLAWIRLLYAYPRPLPPGLVELLAEGGKIIPYLDIPIQHIHPRILRAMGRRTSTEEVEAVLLGLQERIPGLVLRTTAIVGFPGETDEDFAETVDMVERVAYDNVFAFRYSRRPGTPAAAMPDQVSDDSKARRNTVLLEMAERVGAERRRQLEGRIMPVLVDGTSRKNPREATGRTRCNRVVNFDTGGRDLLGAVVPVRIALALPHSLRGEMLDQRAPARASDLAPAFDAR
jgi:ribosomal protein S12 methylthiotransferase